MTIRILLKLLAVCGLLIVPSAYAQTLSILPDTQQLVLGPYLEYLEDASGSYQIDDLLQAGSAHPWQKSDQKILNFGYTDSVYWVRLTLNQAGTQPQRYWLEVAYPALDHIQLYIVRPGQSPQLIEVGDRLPYQQRLVDHPSFLFPFEAVPGEDASLYLRVATSSSLQIPFTLWRGEAFIQKDYERTVGISIFIGIMLVMAAYNFLLFISVREASYFYYVMYALSMVGLTAGIEGITFKFLWPGQPAWNDPFLVLALSGMVLFPCLFTRSFLNMSKARPQLSWLLLLLAGLSILTAVGSFVLDYRLMMVTTMLLTMVSIVINFISGVVRWYDGYYAARYYNLAWSFILGGGMIMALGKLGFLPRTWLTEHAGQIGAALEILLLSFALANRMNYERKTREAAQQESAEAQRKLLQMQIKLNQDLDRLIQARTSELEKANERLQEMSITDELTQLRNRRFFDQNYSKEYMLAHRNRWPIAVLMIDIDHFKELNDTHGHLTGDLCLAKAGELIGQSIQRPSDLAARYGGEEFIVLMPNTDEQGALHVAENILQAFRRTEVNYGEKTIRMTVSIGVACQVPDDSKPENLLKLADNHLYQAKAQGRNQVVWQCSNPSASSMN